MTRCTHGQPRGLPACHGGTATTFAVPIYATRAAGDAPDADAGDSPHDQF